MNDIYSDMFSYKLKPEILLPITMRTMVKNEIATDRSVWLFRKS